MTQVCEVLPLAIGAGTEEGLAGGVLVEVLSFWNSLVRLHIGPVAPLACLTAAA